MKYCFICFKKKNKKKMQEMAMEPEQDAANAADASATSQFYTSTEDQYYTSIGEPAPDNAPSNARVFPTGLKEFQSEDIKEVKREGQTVKIVEKGQGTKLGTGGQSVGIFEVIVDTGIEHLGRNLEYRTFAAKLFKGQPNGSQFGQWQEQAHGPAEYYGGFVCEFYGYCRNYRGSFCLLMCKYDCSLRNVIDEGMMNDDYSGRPFTSATAVGMIYDIAIAMAIVQRENIVHRDLKADNVFVYKHPDDNTPYAAYIGDFDISDTAEGTGYWRAPEILEAVEKRKLDAVKRKLPWTPMADIYSFGMTCYEILTGDRPLEHHPRSDYQDAYKGGLRPILPADLNPMIRDLIVRCWHQDPLQRPTSDAIVLELKEILKEFREVLEIIEKMEELTPLKARPSTEECISRLRRIFQDILWSSLFSKRKWIS